MAGATLLPGRPTMYKFRLANELIFASPAALALTYSCGFLAQSCEKQPGV